LKCRSHVTWAVPLSSAGGWGFASRSLEGAEQVYRHAGDHTETDRLRERTGDLDGTEPLYQQAAERGDVYGLLEHPRLRQGRGNLADAEILAWQTDEYGYLGPAFFGPAARTGRRSRRRRAHPALRSHRRGNSQRASRARFERSLPATCHAARDHHRQRFGAFGRPRDD
ncbi:MAG: hypothetical protein ACRDSH_11635, partial [Pseudonocardiaceae bacterium]